MKDAAIQSAVLERKRTKRRLKARRGNVIFIESTPDMKDWLIERAEKNGRAMVREVVAILEEKRAADLRQYQTREKLSKRNSA